MKTPLLWSPLRHVLLSLLLVGLGVAQGAEPEAFAEANAFFEQGKYAEALAGYAELEKGGTHTANLAYNLGNAEFRLGSPGRAILQYERALRLEPGHPEALANLKLVRTQTGAPVLPALPVARLIPPWSQESVLLLGTGAAWLLLFSGVGLVLARRTRSRGRWLLAGTAALLVGVWCGLVLWHGWRGASVGIVLQPAAEARSSPADRASLVAPLAAGTEVRVLSARGPWTYCELPGERRGWLHAEVVELVQPPEPS